MLSGEGFKKGFGKGSGKGSGKGLRGDRVSILRQRNTLSHGGASGWWAVGRSREKERAWAWA
ncbi:hypothetical protein COCVIDRAFT_108946 [Bipolaris victoriae FI3]|uniref:Uncharacterized protein n=1 Tax=Bipolaris victoriae (strain FI3) TaxID=930091 RepID=W7E8H6_BIPV3|nr:hypothetical protein COCVIDRAFT_108946 [Bipolaris victoriae FI3]